MHNRLTSKAYRARVDKGTARLAPLSLAVAMLGPLVTAALVQAQGLAGQARFEIAAQDLPMAIIQFSDQSGVQVVTADAKLSGLNTRGVNGMLPVEEALRALLSGTGLNYKRVGDATVALVPEGLDSTAARKSDLWEGAQLAQSDSPGIDPNAPQAAEDASSSAQESDQNAARKEAEIEIIVVTAQKREERLQDVPMSITAITAEEIDRRGLVHSEDYLRGIPGVNQLGDMGVVGGQAIIIRGMENTLGYQNFAAGPMVATYFGETPTTSSAGLVGSNVDIKLVDVERVEVLRGPQGTAFGSSSMTGAIRTIPVAPKLDQFEGKAAAGYSSTSGTGGDNYELEAVGNIPLIADRLALRAAAYVYSDSGFYNNRGGSNAAYQAGFVVPFGLESFAVDENEVGSSYVVGGRASALFQASDALGFTLSYTGQKTENDGFGQQNSGTYEQAMIQVAPQHVLRGEAGGIDDGKIDIANAVMNYDLEWADLLATYSYIDGESTAMVPYGPPDNLTWAASAGRWGSHREHSGEVRLVTKLDGAWNFLAGLYAEKFDDEYFVNIYWHGDPATNFFNPNGEPWLYDYLDTRDLKQMAAFGEFSWKFAPGFTLSGGVRAYQYDRDLQLDQSGPLIGGATSSVRNEGDKVSDELFRANLSYQPNDSAHVYASWAQGFRLGKPQAVPPASVCDLDGDGILDGTDTTLKSWGHVDSDSVDSYELGGKFALMNRRLTLDAAVFRMDWTDIPVLQLVPCLFSPQPRNAGTARSAGVELQANFQATEALRVDLGGSWIQAELTEDAPANGYRDGDRLPGSPEFNANLGLQYEFKIGDYDAFVRADSIYVGSFYSFAGELPSLRSDAYVKLNTSARVSIGNLDVDLFVHNLTNEDAFIQHYGFQSEFAGYRLRPLTVGLRLGYQF